MQQISVKSINLNKHSSIPAIHQKTNPIFMHSLQTWMYQRKFIADELCPKCTNQNFLQWKLTDKLEIKKKDTFLEETLVLTLIL